MNRFEKRKLKQNIYKHANAIMYTMIFGLASIITIVAAVHRNDDVAYVDESQLFTGVTESIEINNGESIKVAATGNMADDIETVETTEEITKMEETTEEPTEGTSEISGTKVKVTADSLLVRNEQSQDGEILGILDQDQIIDAVRVFDEWIEIAYEGQTGYISAAYVEILQ